MVRKPSKTQIKFAIKLVIISFAAIGLIFSSNSLDKLTTSTDTRDVFTEAIPERSELINQVTWLKDEPGLVREVDSSTRDLMTDTWIGAFEALGTTGEDSLTTAAVYLSGDALQGVTNGQHVSEFSQLSHQLQLKFISADGQVAAISAPNSVVLAQYEADNFQTNAKIIESYEAILLLEDGNWRINQLVRRSSDFEWVEAS